MLYWRNKSIEKKFQEMKAQAPPNQTRMVFEDLSIVQRSIQEHQAATSCQHTTYNISSRASIDRADNTDDASSRKRAHSPKCLFKQNGITVSSLQFSRSPLTNMDLNVSDLTQSPQWRGCHSPPKKRPSITHYASQGVSIATVEKPRSQQNVKCNRTRIVKQAKQDRMNKML
jgi:hypothetical protein